MYAKPGDWLVVEGHEVGGAVRHGLIEEVHGSEGAPPYLVHWTDTGHRALFFPSTDAYVLTLEQLRKQETVAAERYSSMQHVPGAHGAGPRH